jgi:hypothetical protein
MKLKPNQLALIRHLTQFQTLDYQSCLQMLDDDKIKASYTFRPLTRHKYISKHKNGKVKVLSKGRDLLPDAESLVNVGGGNNERINSISRVAMLLNKIGIESVSSPFDTEYECFIPSACWRKLRTNILSTTRFVGILYVGSHRLAVYDIGDGSMDWQIRAERSLFFPIWHEDFDTHATGMLFICDEDKRIEIAKRIIRETMWRRKQLIETDGGYERLRPVKYSRSPIRLGHYYEHVYLTTPALLKESLKRIKGEENFIEQMRGNNPKCQDVRWGDFEEHPRRYFLNPASDLLKFVFFFSEVKSFLNENALKFTIVLPKSDYPILEMYPDVIGAKGVEIHECKF